MSKKKYKCLKPIHYRKSYTSVGDVVLLSDAEARQVGSSVELVKEKKTDSETEIKSKLKRGK